MEKGLGQSIERIILLKCPPPKPFPPATSDENKQGRLYHFRGQHDQAPYRRHFCRADPRDDAADCAGRVSGFGVFAVGFFSGC